MARPRGARPSPRHRLAAAHPHIPVYPTPVNWLWKPATLSMWLNDQYGDCVTAEEAFAKACYSPEIFISDAEVQSWATAGGFLNGADLITVIDAMQTGGFTQDGKIYDDGPPTSVDWTNASVLCNAIARGPVKTGIAADQIESVVGSSNGWVATGFIQDQNEDHCVSLCGFGTMAWLASQLGSTLPAGVDGTKPGYGLYTWKTIGIIDVPSMLAITGEAWLRTPTTIIN